MSNGGVASNVDSSSTSGMMPGQCDVVLRVLPPGTGSEVGNFKSFQDFKDYQPSESYKFIKKTGNDLYEAEFQIATKKTPTQHYLEILNPLPQGYVCVGDDNQVRVQYLYGNSNEGSGDTSLSYKLKLTNYDFKTEGDTEDMTPGEVGEIIIIAKDVGSGTPTLKDFFSSRSHLDDEYIEANLEYSINYNGKEGSTYKNTFYLNYDSKCKGSWVDPDADDGEEAGGGTGIQEEKGLKD